MKKPSAEQLLTAALLSGFMSLVIAGLSTWHAAGNGPELIRLWLGAWVRGWIVALPLVLVAAPMARRGATYLLSLRA
ncbi:DUF2798 domain-containing protein [Ramlibacter algicola]|uniref:DUF2798 domain-containing protein n=1 Tax=Ramlibacter algicola TaxID=2795217 RepID=A0A934Q418_9BURK|nr:DUF2798 domain-containing protein [Ramlibacter algicola]MBK0393822.1 DUF2798 domain-containing protein [Ramlibacter algicola]